MASTENREKPESPRNTGLEPKLGVILCNPAPDAEDRLRRLFTLLAKHISREGAKPPKQESPLEDGSAEVKWGGLPMATREGYSDERLTVSPLTPISPSGIIQETSWPGGAINTPGHGATCSDR